MCVYQPVMAHPAIQQNPAHSGFTSTVKGSFYGHHSSVLPWTASSASPKPIAASSAGAIRTHSPQINLNLASTQRTIAPGKLLNSRTLDIAEGGIQRVVSASTLITPAERLA